MLFTLALLAGAALTPSPQAADPLALYVFSLDSDSGFEDELLDVFRRELGRHVESFTQVAYSRDDADVAVQFLGQGELAIELSAAGETRGYAFTPDESAPRMWALVHVGGHSRAFAVEGTGARKMSELGQYVARWIRDRSTTIRERRP